MVIYMISWWYLKGWGMFAKSTFSKQRRLADYFSIGLLLRTWFEPFRQISAGGTSSEALDARFHAFIDKLISRVIGFITRTFIMVFGIVTMAVQLVLSIILTMCWPLVPLMPIAAVFCFIMGVTL